MLKILKLLNEPLEFTFEHSKFHWFMLSVVYCIGPAFLIAYMVRIIFGGWRVINLWMPVSIIAAFAFSALFAGIILDLTKKEVEWKRQRELDMLVRRFPCKHCDGKGYILTRGLEKER